MKAVLHAFVQVDNDSSKPHYCFIYYNLSFINFILSKSTVLPKLIVDVGLELVSELEGDDKVLVPFWVIPFSKFTGLAVDDTPIGRR